METINNEPDLYSSNLFRLEKQNKRHKKFIYKRNKEAMLESPPSIYNINHMDHHANESIGVGYDHHERYYVPSQNVPFAQYMEPVYYNIHPSQLHHVRKYYKDRHIQYYAPIYGMPRVGT